MIEEMELDTAPVRDGEDDALDDEVGVIRGEIWDNCRDWCRKCDIVYIENEFDRVVSRCRGCGKVLGFIPRAGIDEYLKTLDPEERKAREFGTWKHLAGLVYKELDRQVHIYDDFPIPESWMKIESVDPHDSRATHWGFAAVSPEEYELFGKKCNRIYWYDTLLLTGSIEDMTRKVKSLRALHGYIDAAYVILDKKMGEKTQIEGVSWEGKLYESGIKHIKLSQSGPGDVELGHKVVREYLKPKYSTLLDAVRPGMMFAKNGCGGSKGLIRSMFNYQYDEKTEKPVEAFKDWPDIVRYVAMERLTLNTAIPKGWTPNMARKRQ